MPIKPTKKGQRLYNTKIKPTLRRLRKDVRQIKSQIEKKHHDKSTTEDCGTDSTITALTLMSQGDTSSTRTGLKIFVKSIHCKLQFLWTTTATQETHWRFIVFLDRNSNGSLPVLANVLESATNTMAHLNNVNEGRRFVILKDVIYNNKNVDSTVPKYEQRNFIIKVNKSVWALDSTANATALGRNQVYACFVGNTAKADADSVNATLNTRAYFIDA